MRRDYFWRNYYVSTKMIDKILVNNTYHSFQGRIKDCGNGGGGTYMCMVALAYVGVRGSATSGVQRQIKPLV